MYAVSPLRYPGAKWRLYNFVSSILKENKLKQYVEPYAGGASLALSLLIKEQVAEIHLNDRDRSVWAFWKSVTDHSSDLIERVRHTEITMDNWYQQREVQSNKMKASILDLGFSTFFLNRTNRSGILTAGVIGGKDQLGKWKIDARFNKDNLIERLKAIAQFRSRIHVTRLDAITLIKRRTQSLSRDSLIYLDPPYYVKGQDLYMNAYGPFDHAAVAKTVTSVIDVPWIVSYDDVPEIRQLYSGWKSHHYLLRYSASSTRKGREVIFMSKGLKVQTSFLIDA